MPPFGQPETPKPEPETLKPSPGALLTIVVVMALAAIGEAEQKGDRSQQQGYAFGGWTKPVLRRLADDSLSFPIRPVPEQPSPSELPPSESPPSEFSPDISVQLLPADGFRFYRIEDFGDPNAISFVHSAQQLIGRISLAKPSPTLWASARLHSVLGPDAITNQLLDEEPSEDEGQAVPLELIEELAEHSQRHRIQVTSIQYQHCEVIWIYPRECAEWPARLCTGRCQLGDTVVWIRVYELGASSAEPPLQSGAIAGLVGMLQPLASAANSEQAHEIAEEPSK